MLILQYAHMFILEGVKISCFLFYFAVLISQSSQYIMNECSPITNKSTVLQHTSRVFDEALGLMAPGLDFFFLLYYFTVDSNRNDFK